MAVIDAILARIVIWPYTYTPRAIFMVFNLEGWRSNMGVLSPLATLGVKLGAPQGLFKAGGERGPN